MDLFDGLRGGEIEVELEAYVVPNEHRVWKATAGKTHRFYRAVRDANAIFPDIRGLGALGKPGDWTDAKVLKAIAADRWQREQASRDKGNAEHGSEAVSKQDRGVLTFARRLWFEAKRGDIVVIPADGWREAVLIGEILSDVGELVRVEARDGEFKGEYFGRPVAWRKSVSKADLTPELLKIVHTRAAVFSMPESVKEEVYRFAYGNFVYRGSYVAEFRTSKQRFTAEDSAVVGTWLNAMDVLRNSVERGDTRPQESIADLGLEKLPDHLAAELKINIQSPGEIFVRTLGPFALTLMALFALGGCDAETIDKNKVTVTLKQVGVGDPSVQQEIEGNVNALKTALGVARIEKSNGLIKRAEKDAKMSTGAVLKSAPVKGK